MNTVPLLTPLVVRHGAFALARAHARGARILKTEKAGRDGVDLLRLLSSDLLRAGARAIDGFPETDVPVALDEIETALRFAANRHWGPGEVLGLRECGRIRKGEVWRFPACLASGRFEGTGPDDVFALLAMIATTLWGRGANWWCYGRRYRPERQAPYETMAAIADDIRQGALVIRSPDDLAPVATATAVLIEAGAPPTLLAAHALAGPCARRNRLRRLCREIDGTAEADPTYGLG